MTTTFRPTDTIKALAEGYAARLAAKLPAYGINAVWPISGTLAGDAVGIFYGPPPPDPDRVISVSPRRLTAGIDSPDSTYAIQLRLRGLEDLLDVWHMSDATRDVMLTGSIVLPNGLYVASVQFQGGTTLGMDPRNRQEWSDNYVMGLGEHRASPFTG